YGRALDAAQERAYRSRHIHSLISNVVSADPGDGDPNIVRAALLKSMSEERPRKLSSNSAAACTSCGENVDSFSFVYSFNRSSAYVSPRLNSGIPRVFSSS